MLAHSPVSEVVALAEVTSIFGVTLVLFGESKVLLPDVVLSLDLFSIEARVNYSEEARVVDLSWFE
jgi:hypothetical protein